MTDTPTTDTESLATTRQFQARINGQTLCFGDPVPTSRQILDAADFRPADDCILVQIFTHGSRAIGLDETVDLRQPGTEEFQAFRSDRTFRFTVDERGFDWGAPEIDELALRAIGHLDRDLILLLERENEPDRELGPHDKVDLARGGTEHLRTRKRLVTVYYGPDDAPFQFKPGLYSTEQLIGIFPVPEGYLLNELEDGKIVTLKQNQKVHIKDGLHFYSQPPGGGSS
jgi:hypothetical protein